VDLEAVVPNPAYEQIAGRFFSSREQAAFHALRGNERLEAFYKIWTGKEAYLKACGEGLTQPLDDIDIPLDSEESFRFLKVSRNIPEDSHWSIQHLRPTSGFVAALVVEGSSYSLSCWQWPGLQFRPM
jgi:4'-phosphopantetheinyl transferase